MNFNSEWCEPAVHLVALFGEVPESRSDRVWVGSSLRSSHRARREMPSWSIFERL